MLFLSLIVLIICKALPSLNTQLPVKGNIRISSLVLLFCAILSFNTLYIESIGSGISIYGGLFHITVISQLIDIFIFIIAAFILMCWPLNNFRHNNFISNSTTLKSLITNLYTKDIETKTLSTQKYLTTNYSLLILFSILGASLLISSYDLISLYLSIELQSFGVYILATLYRNSQLSTAAGLKYFLLGGLSSCFILLGAGLIYAFTGLTNFESMYILISGTETSFITQGFFFGLILIIVGFLFKVSAAPLHNWAPDVYDDTPTIVTIWLTVMPKISILILLLEIYTGFFSNTILDSNIINIINVNNTLYDININSIIKNLLLISSILSLIIGSVVGLSQIRIKRLLAYSTISHIGFILLALAINTEQSIDSFIFYIIQYTITNLNMFLILIALSYLMNWEIFSYRNKEFLIRDIKYISELKSQFFKNPFITISLLICLFSMAGVPPLIGFFAKQFVLYSALQSGYNFISFIAILVSVISASYYIKIVKVLIQDTQNKINTSEISDLWLEQYKGRIISESHSYLISMLTFIILLFILKPSLILNSTQLLTLSLFYF